MGLFRFTSKEKKSLFIFLNMKPLSVEMACLLGIQNEIQAECNRVEFLKIILLDLIQIGRAHFETCRGTRQKPSTPRLLLDIYELDS